MKRRDFVLSSALLGLPTIVWADEEPAESQGHDLIVVGGGAGGLTAAYCAAKNGGSVLLIEKSSRLGGDTLLSGGYFNAVLTEEESKFFPGIERDSVDLFANQINSAADGYNNPLLGYELAKRSRSSFEWLKSLGINFLPKPFLIYGGSYPRSFLPESGDGKIYIQILAEACMREKVKFLYKTKVISLIKSRYQNKVIGVLVQSGTRFRSFFSSKGVIVAAGGFGANKDKINTLLPNNPETGTDSNPNALGDLHNAIAEVGGKLINMDFVEYVPGASHQDSYSVRLDYNPEKVVLVNEKGERFVEETKPRNEIAAKYFSGKFKKCFTITDNETVQQIEPGRRKNIYRGLYNNTVWRAGSISQLADKLNIPASALMKTIEENKYEKKILSPPYWAANVVFRVHLTLGGACIDNRARVLSEKNQPIQGIWATGQIVGNIHGKNRLGGNGINSAVIFGRLAAFDAMMQKS